MPSNWDATPTFLRLLEFCALEARLVSQAELRALEKQQAPCNPLDPAAASDRPELRFAMTQAFNHLLRAPLDGNRIRRCAADLVSRLDAQQPHRNHAALATRWLPLETDNDFFDPLRWAACWSRRDLEGVLGFFTDDAIYIDAARNLQALGKSGLRRLLSRLFHASDATVACKSARFVPADGDVELEWAQEGARIPGLDASAGLGAGSVRGKSNLQIEAGKVAACIDCPSVEDLEQIGRRSLGFSKTAGGGEVRETPAYVLLNRLVVFKRPLRLKKPGPAPGQEQKHEP